MELTGRGARPADALDYTIEESIEELASLAESAGADVVDRVLQARPAADAATLIGSGKLDELVGAVRASSASLVVFDQELTPTQLRNLERKLDCKILDRTQLILDIFASRARTREGQLQVELAQLNYLLPRLTGRGIEMSRLGGGIGTRGPGETQLETDRRRIFRRIRKLEGDLEAVRGSRTTQRRQRQGVPLATIALVGYTNAGKSTLFNRLTGAGVLADAKMFATLDPTVRAATLPSRRNVLFSDTVGFIRSLPTTLVRAFRATLEEVVEAALLLHVVDASSPRAGHQREHVLKVLGEIGASSTPQLMVWNKTDRMEAPLPVQQIPSVGVSALSGAGLDELLASIDNALPADPVTRARFRVPAGDGATLHLLHERARVIEQRYDGEMCEIEAEVPDSLLHRLPKSLRV